MKWFAALFLATIFMVAPGLAQAPTPPAPPIPTPTPAPTPPAPTPVPVPFSFSISGDTTVPCYSMVKLSLAGGPASSVWMVIPDPTSEYSCGPDFNFSGSPGNYTVLTFAITTATPPQPVIVKTVCTIQPLPGPVPPTPGPGPPAPPGPGPAPTPTGQVWALAVFDTANQVSLPTGQLAIYGSPTIQSAVKSAGAVWRRYDVNDMVPTKSGGSIPLSTSKWGAAAITAGLPALVMFDSTGAVIEAIKLPADEAGVTAAVKAVAGGGK